MVVEMAETGHSDVSQSLVLETRALLGAQDRVERSYPPSTFDTGPGDGYTVATAVIVKLVVDTDGEIVRLRGRVTTAMRLACGRCLEAFDRLVDLEVDLRYLPQRANTGDGDAEVFDDDLSTAFYRDDEIDLGHLVREQLQLAAPMKPLCREACRGLCSVCGINRNMGQCSCKIVWRDPRLAALRSMVRGEPGHARKD